MTAKLDLTQNTLLPSQQTDVNQHLSLIFEIDVSLLPMFVRQFEQLLRMDKTDEQ
jgi:hypothetical protein